MSDPSHKIYKIKNYNFCLIFFRVHLPFHQHSSSFSPTSTLQHVSVLFQCSQQICRRPFAGCCAPTSRMSSSSTRRPATLITFICDTWRKWDKKNKLMYINSIPSNCSFSVSLARMCEVSSTDSETPSTCRVWLNWADKAKCIELVLNWELLFAHCTRR